MQAHAHRSNGVEVREDALHELGALAAIGGGAIRVVVHGEELLELMPPQAGEHVELAEEARMHLQHLVRRGTPSDLGGAHLLVRLEALAARPREPSRHELLARKVALLARAVRGGQ